MGIISGAIVGHDTPQPMATNNIIQISPSVTRVQSCKYHASTSSCRSLCAEACKDVVEDATGGRVRVKPDWLFKKEGGGGCEWTFGAMPEEGDEIETGVRCNGRRDAFKKGFALASAGSVAATTAKEQAFAGEVDDGKRTGLSNSELRDIVTSDIVNNQFLTNGKLTRSIYDEKATFTDEIDTYTLDKWIVGTGRLFNGDNSDVELVGDVMVDEGKVEFRFDEVLEFNIPLHPKVKLTGRVVLSRDKSTGLINSYREFWDQPVNEVLKSAKFRL
eukprot:CAMPEP_0118659110 /NCGR_PEP_ID=MMETSP0785-20121206/14929_1 /TAXON_ID=91992 /ORGANISM="Bolidomonas pacifica, Strain CCMP 1866" /LENGTH=273 /DNA_ID=CAMNT_0006552177 /DNA_START=441 /DNA_END=1262 /DNA_ORIENTATION=+